MTLWIELVRSSGDILSPEDSFCWEDCAAAGGLAATFLNAQRRVRRPDLESSGFPACPDRMFFR